VVVWYIFPVLVCLDHEKSGNPGHGLNAHRNLKPRSRKGAFFLQKREHAVNGVKQPLIAPHPQNTRPSQLTKPVFKEQKVAGSGVEQQLTAFRTLLF
jgi:hypothetical protein